MTEKTVTSQKWYSSPAAQEYLVYLSVILLSSVLLISPVTFQLEVTTPTKDFVNRIRSIPQGGVMLWDESSFVTGYYTQGQISLYKLFFDQAKQRAVRIIFISSCVDGPMAGAMINKQLEVQDTTGLKYGVNYVNLGWQPGFELVLSAIAKDIQTVTKADAYGTAISDLPMMKGLTTQNIDLFAFNCGVSCDPWMRQWVPLGKPILMQGGYALISQASGYIQSGSITAYLNGERGYVEMERMTGYISMRTALFEATNIMGPYSIILVIVCNISYMLQKRRKQRGQ